MQTLEDMIAEALESIAEDLRTGEFEDPSDGDALADAVIAAVREELALACYKAGG